MEKKDAGLRIRVERDLRDDFIGVCQKQGKPAAQVLREFMRTYVSNDVAPKSTRRGDKAGQS